MWYTNNDRIWNRLTRRFYPLSHLLNILGMNVFVKCLTCGRVATPGIPRPSFFSSSSERLEKLIFLRPSVIPVNDPFLWPDSPTFASDFVLGISEFFFCSSPWSVPADSDLVRLMLFRVVEAVLLSEGLFLAGFTGYDEYSLYKDGLELYIKILLNTHRLDHSKKFWELRKIWELHKTSKVQKF